MEIPTKENIERKAMNIVYQLDDDSGLSVEFRQKNSDKRIEFVKSILVQFQKETIEAIRLEEVKESPYVHAEWAQKKYPTGEVTKTNLHRKGYNQAVSEQQSLIDNILK